MIDPKIKTRVGIIQEIIDRPDTNKYLKNLEIMTATVEMFVQTFNGSEARYSMEKANEYAKALFNYAKFEVGQTVMLGNQWDNSIATQSGGWQHHAHYLITGARCVIKGVDYREKAGGFIYDVMFEDESWVPTHGKEKGIPQPVSDKHLFCIAERYLVEDEGPYVIRLKNRTDDWIFIAEEDEYNNHLEKLKNARCMDYDEAKEELARQKNKRAADDLEIVLRSVASEDYFKGYEQ